MQTLLQITSSFHIHFLTTNLLFSFPSPLLVRSQMGLYAPQLVQKMPANNNNSNSWGCLKKNGIKKTLFTCRQKIIKDLPHKNLVLFFSTILDF